MASLRDIVVDCAHPAALARFWAGALDGYEVALYDDAELARLRSIGVLDIEDDPTVLVTGPARPRLFFQRVPEPRRVKNRLHLDLTAGEPEAEIARLTGLGARVAARYAGHVTLTDPEGNEFCVMLP